MKTTDKLQAEETDTVTFDFEEFNVEPGKDCKHDYVKIYNKDVSEKLVLQKNCVFVLQIYKYIVLSYVFYGLKTVVH